MACTIVAVILFALLPYQSTAFGPRLEPIKGGCGPTSNLFAVSDFDDQDESENMSAAKCRAYASRHENQYEEVNSEIIRRSLFIAEPFLFDSSMFGVRNPFELPDVDVVTDTIVDNSGYGSCSGDDCDDCLIPEDFKHVERPVDVMAYLGIKRVAPIRGAHQSGDWE